MAEPTDIEKENLEAHVELCAQRYGQLDSRLSTIENEVKDIKTTIEKGHLGLIRVLIYTTGTMIAGIVSTIIVVLTR